VLRLASNLCIDAHSLTLVYVKTPDAWRIAHEHISLNAGLRELNRSPAPADPARVRVASPGPALDLPKR